MILALKLHHIDNIFTIMIRPSIKHNPALKPVKTLLFLNINGHIEHL